MTAAPQSPLVERVAEAIRGVLKPIPYPGDVEEAAQAAIEACQAEAMHAALTAAHAHVSELRNAWQRGAISEHGGQGGTRSNRNVEVEVQLRVLLAKLEGRS